MIQLYMCSSGKTTFFNSELAQAYKIHCRLTGSSYFSWKKLLPYSTLLWEVGSRSCRLKPFIKKALRKGSTRHVLFFSAVISLSSQLNSMSMKRPRVNVPLLCQDLMDALKSELSGNFEDCLLAILEPAALYDAKCLRRAMEVGNYFPSPYVDHYNLVSTSSPGYLLPVNEKTLETRLVTNPWAICA